MTTWIHSLKHSTTTSLGQPQGLALLPCSSRLIFITIVLFGSSKSIAKSLLRCFVVPMCCVDLQSVGYEVQVLLLFLAVLHLNFIFVCASIFGDLRWFDPVQA